MTSAVADFAGSARFDGLPEQCLFVAWGKYGLWHAGAGSEPVPMSCRHALVLTCIW